MSAEQQSVVSVEHVTKTFAQGNVTALQDIELELMRSYAAGRWAVLWKVRVPASLPYVFSAFRIAATASVVGAIIGELPSGLQSGLGGAIINFNQYYSLEPQELWATNIVAALVGIAFFVIIVIAEKAIVRRPPETTT